MKGVGTLVKIGIPTLMEHKQENTILEEKKKITNFRTQETFLSIFAQFVSI